MGDVVQVALRSGATRLTCWVDGDRRLRVGNLITLKNADEPGRWWTVCAIGEPKDSSAIHSDWNVGGVRSRR